MIIAKVVREAQDGGDRSTMESPGGGVGRLLLTLLLPLTNDGEAQQRARDGGFVVKRCACSKRENRGPKEARELGSKHSRKASKSGRE